MNVHGVIFIKGFILQRSVSPSRLLHEGFGVLEVSLQRKLQIPRVFCKVFLEDALARGMVFQVSFVFPTVKCRAATLVSFLETVCLNFTKLAEF